jgi:hypothetical protein
MSLGFAPDPEGEVINSLLLGLLRFREKSGSVRALPQDCCNLDQIRLRILLPILRQYKIMGLR